MYFASFLLLVWVPFSTLAVEDATKNHRLEKRQDDSLLFFGGWRPVQPAASTSYFHKSTTGRYHDLISALPGSLDAASRYYAQALPSNYHRDIYSYYPRPAIRNRPKKNTPVYMERFKPRRQQPKHGSRGHGGGGGGGGGSPQIIDIQNIDLKQLHGLQDLILQAKELPLTHLNLPRNGGNQYDLLQLSLPSLPQNSYDAGSRSVNRYSRNKRPQMSSGVYGGRMSQSYAQAQSPFEFQYIEVPKAKDLLSQIQSKDISISNLQLPHQISSVDDLLDLKNIQVIEVPVPSVSSGKSNQGYGTRNTAYSQPQYRSPSPKSATKVSFPASTYYTHQTQQSPNRYTPKSKSGYSQQQQQMPQIEAELVKLTEDEIQRLLSKLQMVQKNSQEFLKILPFAQAPHNSEDGQVQLIFLQDQGEQNGKSTGSNSYGANGKSSGYNSNSYKDSDKSSGYDSNGYGDSGKSSKYDSNGYGDSGKSSGYDSNGYGDSGKPSGYDSNGYGDSGKSSGYDSSGYGDSGKSSGYDSNGYGDSGKSSGYDSNSYGDSGKSSGYDSNSYGANQGEGYKDGEQQYVAIPQDESYSSHGSSGNSGGYQTDNQAVHNAAGYQIDEQTGRNPYEQKYQNAEEEQSYGQAGYEQDGKNEGYSESGQQDYKQKSYGSKAPQQEQYLEIISPASGNGYRREPVLAVEIQKGQSIVDVIKAIDPATLQRLGAHGKEGLEIEVVEVPVDEYSAESKKSVTYVASTNATTEAPAKKTSVTPTTVSQDKSTTTKKS